MKFLSANDIDTHDINSLCKIEENKENRSLGHDKSKSRQMINFINFILENFENQKFEISFESRNRFINEATRLKERLGSNKLSEAERTEIKSILTDCLCSGERNKARKPQELACELAGSYAVSSLIQLC